MIEETLYKQLTKESKRLKIVLDTNVIIAAFTERQILSILEHSNGNILLPELSEKLIENELVKVQAAKILGLMEASDTKEEFEALQKKQTLRKQKNNPVNVQDFNNTLKQLLNTQPSANKKKKEH